jgi:uncharacterized protein (DUF885 family)
VRRIADEFAAAANDRKGTQSWGVPSPADREARNRKQDEWATALSSIDGNALYGTDVKPSLDWRIYGSVREAIESFRGLRVCRQELWNVDQLFGWQAQAEYNAAVAPVATEKQQKALLESFALLPGVAAISISDLREGVKLGYTAPRIIVERVIGQLDAMLADTSDSSSLAAPIKRNASPEFRAAWKKVVADSVIPAMRSYRDYLANEYVKTARAETSLAAIPDGKACYRAQLRALTTVDASPDSLVALGGSRLAGSRMKFSRLATSSSAPLTPFHRCGALAPTRRS